MTLAELRGYIRRWMENTYSASKMTEGKKFTLSDTDLDEEINLTYRTFASYVKVRSGPTLLSTTADDATYDLPSTLFSIDDIFYTSGTQTWKLKRIETASERLFAGTLLDSDPSMYETRNQTNQITLYPAPQNDGETVTVYGTLLVADLSADSDTPLIPSNYHQTLCDMVIARLMVQAGMYNTDKVSAVQLFKSLEDDMRARAKACKLQFQKTNDNQGWIDNQFSEACRKFAYPVVNHNPVLSTLHYINDLIFRNYDTGFKGMKVDGTGVYFYDDDDDSLIFSVTPTAITWLGAAIFGRIETVPDSDNYNYTYVGALGTSYELTIYAENAAATANACLTVRILHHAATFAPDITLIESQSNSTGGASAIVITPSSTIGSANLTINVTNANAGKFIVGTRNAVSIV